eukprot:TRINITY_DN11317_c0_g1_i2.p1 TRINITY_DN11317_c0_g1~~TRINITY_DN11317_c0_g1_i2.p1  ORF type:complete len:348 (+),score=21.52 TRINITY_DN11317_c0_g1_i2:64-1107(+)
MCIRDRFRIRKIEKNFIIDPLTRSKIQTKISNKGPQSIGTMDDPGKMAANNQAMQKWQGSPTLTQTIGLFLFLVVFYTTWGVMFTKFSSDVKSLSLIYSDLAPDCAIHSTCLVQFEITEQMDGPVHVYYSLDNFYQNHFKYLNSIDYEQLLDGKVKTVDELEEGCRPVLTMNDTQRTVSYTGVRIPADAPANPCGIFAKTFFNDTFKLAVVESNGTIIPVHIDETNIAWPPDRHGGRFKKPLDSESIQWINVHDEHFLVWMRPAGMPGSKKLWGRIAHDLSPGTYQLIFENNFNKEFYHTKKEFTLSTVNNFGGDNTYLYVALFIAAGVCAIIIVIGLGCKLRDSRK